MNRAIATELRELCTKLRYTAMPIADIIPSLQRAADALDGCICSGNWREIVAAHENDIGKTYTDPDGRQYIFFGIVHGGDDYYYGMRARESRRMRLLSCVGSLTQGHGFTEVT